MFASEEYISHFQSQSLLSIRNNILFDTRVNCRLEIFISKRIGIFIILKII